ncbi:ATP-binding protein [Sorangium sp. So ce296]|uniref:AAA family ATPase n=1 Tax=Sorangium sp. So ce296 TaxID=3133296 RepID=UPI003F5F66EF
MRGGSCTRPQARVNERAAMLTEAHFKNFKLLRDVRLPLGPLNVLVGPNAVGKSTVLEGMHYLLQLAAAKPATLRPGSPFWSKRAVEDLVAKPDATELALEAVLADGRRFGIRAGAAKEEPEPERFHLWFGKEGQETELRLPSGDQEEERLFFRGPREAKLGSVVRLKLHAETLAAEHYSEEEIPGVGHDGEGLASVLQYVQGLRDGTLEAIEHDLATIVPGARRIRALPARLKRRETHRISVDGQDFWTEQSRDVTGARFEVEWEGLGWVPAGQLSEGTLLALGLITVVRFDAPRLVLLDDLDKALHPVAQRKLVAHLRGVLDTTPHLQIVATSHSPFLLDELRVQEVIVMSRAGARGSALRRLDEHPTSQKRGAYLRPGELWSLVDEGWVSEGVG